MGKGNKKSIKKSKIKSSILISIFWSHFLKVGKNKNKKTKTEPNSSNENLRQVWKQSLGQLLGMDGTVMEASILPLCPLRAPRPALEAGPQSALVHTQLPPWGCVVSEHREEAALLFFLLNLESTSLNWHRNRWFVITGQTTTQQQQKYLFPWLVKVHFK